MSGMVKSTCTKQDFLLSRSERAYVAKLQTFGPHAIPEYQKLACKELGQAIFNRYKKESGSSREGFYTAVRIFTALAYNSKGIQTPEWILFRASVGKAWNGIGDSTGRWTT